MRVLPLLLVFVACAPSADVGARSDAPPSPMSQQEAEVFLNTLATEIRTADTSMFASYYHPYATFITAGRRVDSRDSIAKFLREAVEAGQGRTLEFHPVRFGASGDLAWLLVHFTGGFTSRTGFLMTVMERGADGRMAIVSQAGVEQ